MASQPSKTADELTTAIRSLVDKSLESQTREQIAARGREVAAAIAGTAGTAAGRASDIANDQTAKRMRRDGLKWGRRAWLKQLQPALRNAWSRRAAAIGAAGLAVPASRELVDQARIRLGLRQREESRWRIFFIGLVLGAIGGAIAALLTAPRPGREVRDELASRARDAATNAGEWVPIFQREAAEAPSIAQPLVGEVSPPTTTSETSAATEKPVRPRKRAGETRDIARSSGKGNGAEGLSSSPLPEIDQTETDPI
ncbi:MAG: YtxH domain-containing protein [Chloroflexi bacterium]|nr:MAG: YtxH domain-containing protein [Chloroflexota bacterium]